MGNSKTSRYADGRDLYEPSTLRDGIGSFLRSYSTGGDQELADALVAAARRGHRDAPARARRAMRRVPAPASFAPRRFQGEVARVLLDPITAPRVRRLARRHQTDESDVALLWTGTVAHETAAEAHLPLSSAEASPA